METNQPKVPSNTNQRAQFTDEEVTKAVEEFIKDKKLVNGVYV
jgi:hypothetical protein